MWILYFGYYKKNCIAHFFVMGKVQQTPLSPSVQITKTFFTHINNLMTPTVRKKICKVFHVINSAIKFPVSRLLHKWCWRLTFLDLFPCEVCRTSCCSGNNVGETDAVLQQTKVVLGGQGLRDEAGEIETLPWGCGEGRGYGP